MSAVMTHLKLNQMGIRPTLKQLSSTSVDHGKRPATVSKTVVFLVGHCAAFVVLCGVLTGGTSAGTEDPSALEFQGEVKTEVYDPHTGAVVQNVSYAYVIHVHGNHWRITTLDRQATQGARKSADRTEIAFDGRDLYALVHFPDHVLSEYRKKDKVDYPIEVGHVQEGGFPVTADPVQKLLWLAYCSQSYLSNHSGQSMPSLVDLTMAKDPPTVRVAYELLSGSGSLPRQFNEFAPGRRWVVEKGALVYVPCPPPFDKEFLAFRYEAEEATNHAGALFPTRFRAEYLMPVESPGSVPVNRVVTVQVGLLRSLRVVEAGDFRPNITAEAIIRDTRFPEYAQAPVIAYREPQPTWLDRNSSTLKSDIAAKPRLRPLPRPGGQKPSGPLQLFFLATLGALLGLPAFLVIWKRHKGKHQKTHEANTQL